MSHECKICGQECYCDMDDCGGLPQPANCIHFRHHKESSGDGEYDVGMDDDEDTGEPADLEVMMLMLF